MFGSVWQCLAVFGSAHGSVRAMHAAVCGSALGSVSQCVRQYAAVCRSAAVCGSATVCGSAAVSGSASGSVWQGAR